MGSPVAWFEIAGKDQPKLAAFYAALFGWSTSPMRDEMYAVVDTQGGDGAIGGGIGQSQSPEAPGGTTIYMKVDDLQAYLDRAVDLGGAILVPPTPLPGDFGAFAPFADPEGHAVGLWG